MAKQDWIRKLTSRKFWVAVCGLVSGLILAFGGDESIASTVSGVILQAASVLGYLLAEGLSDAAYNKTLPTETEEEDTEAEG